MAGGVQVPRQDGDTRTELNDAARGRDQLTLKNFSLHSAIPGGGGTVTFL